MFLLVVFMYNQTLHRHRKHFSRYYLQFFGTAQILKRFVNYSLEFKYEKKYYEEIKCHKNYQSHNGCSFGYNL